jgi:hypothetical protein
MSDRPDFTSNTALNAVADTLDNLPVSINAQTLGSLAVDIAAQSAGDIDINLNTASDTVTVALGSSTVTLDVNISDSNATVDTNISGSSTTLDTDIAAQSVGSIDTVIDGQTGDVGISFNSQTGNVDINFQSQSGAVESGTEFAASQANTVSGTVIVGASAGNNDVATLFDNTTGNPVVVEFVSGSQVNGFADPVRLQFQLRDASANTIAEVEANPVNLPLSLDPGVRIPSNGDVEARLENNAGSAVAYSLELIGREVI